MDLTTELTVANLTPPGYFNLSAASLASTKAYVEWWNTILEKRAENSIDFKTLLLTPWLYDHLDYPRTPWLLYLTTMYGMGFFGGTNNQAAYLYRLLSSAWSVSTIFNISMILQTLSMAPFSWFTVNSPDITAGNLVSSYMDTGLLIYSTAASPSTPADTPYIARAWITPTGWTKKAASAVKYSRGYLSGGVIKWCAPRPVADFSNVCAFSANVPIAIPSAGTVAIVNDDGTGDIGSVYYCDGVAWRKNSTPNEDLGLIIPDSARPFPEAITVWAPNPESVTYAVDSQVPPPADGASEGYGTFSTWANSAVFTNNVTIYVTQIAGGSIAVATLIELLRRVKPINKLFTLHIGTVIYTITDVRQK
jgi:hypothetical protein